MIERLEENKCEQLRLRIAVEYNGERKRNPQQISTERGKRKGESCCERKQVQAHKVWLKLKTVDSSLFQVHYRDSGAAELYVLIVEILDKRHCA